MGLSNVDFPSSSIDILNHAVIFDLNQLSLARNWEYSCHLYEIICDNCRCSVSLMTVKQNTVASEQSLISGRREPVRKSNAETLNMRPLNSIWVNRKSGEKYAMQPWEDVIGRPTSHKEDLKRSQVLLDAVLLIWSEHPWKPRLSDG
jgi:hypothetical protein